MEGGGPRCQSMAASSGILVGPELITCPRTENRGSPGNPDRAAGSQDANTAPAITGSKRIARKREADMSALGKRSPRFPKERKPPFPGKAPFAGNPTVLPRTPGSRSLASDGF